jgi:hypothetical protein
MNPDDVSVTNIDNDIIVFSDNFNTGSDQELTTRTPQLGLNWSLMYTTGGGLLEANSGDNTLQKGSGGNGSGDAALYGAEVSGGYSSANYTVSITQTNGDTADDYNFIAARVQDSNTLYGFNFNESDGQLYKRVSGTWTALGAQTSGITNGSIIKLKVQGTSISVEENGAPIVSVTDSSITSAGRAAIGMGAVQDPSHDLNKQELDNFSVQIAD